MYASGWVMLFRLPPGIVYILDFNRSRTESGVTMNSASSPLMSSEMSKYTLYTPCVVVLVFDSPASPGHSEFSRHQSLHGDAVKDIAFRVDDLKLVVQCAKEQGATLLQDVTTLTDEAGSVQVAVVAAYGDVVHTLIQRDDYQGVFLPGYSPPITPPFKPNFLSERHIVAIDHVVGNVPENQMETTASWYQRVLQLCRFWSLPDQVIQTAYSGLRSVIMANQEDEQAKIKLLVIEPRHGHLSNGKSQIQEFLDYNSGAGIQHVAFLTTNIMHSVAVLRARGVEFIRIPGTYYQKLKERLCVAAREITESLAELEALGILVDFDEQGYLLQTFTKPLQDRPTLFIELIQRHNHQGFGAGNIRALFEAVELDQQARGNLITMS